MDIDTRNKVIHSLPLCVEERKKDLLLEVNFQNRTHQSYDGIQNTYTTSSISVTHIGNLIIFNKPFSLATSISHELLQLLENNISVLARNISGWGCLLINNKQNGQISLITDRLGLLPIYYVKKSKGVYIDWDEDYLSSHLGISELDKISIYEVLARGKVTPPHTLYQNMGVFPPSTIVTINTENGKLTTEQYWSPNPNIDHKKTSEQLASDIVGSITASINKITNKTEASLEILLSGGLDSRMLLPTISKSGLKTTAYTIYSKKNKWSMRELNVSKALAKHYGLEHISLERTLQTLKESFQQSVNSCGGSKNVRHCYCGGFSEFSSYKPNQPFLMTGCYADHLFKMDNPKKQEIRNLTPDLNWFCNVYEIKNKEISSEIEERVEQFASLRNIIPSDLKTEEGRTYISLQRVLPIYNLRTLTFRRQLMSARKLVFPLLDNEVLDVWQTIGDKRGKKIWLQALEIMDPKLTSFVNSNTAIAPKTENKRMANLFLTKVKRKFSNISTKNSKKPISSWDDSGNLIDFEKEFKLFLEKFDSLTNIMENIDISDKSDLHFWSRALTLQLWLHKIQSR